MVSSPNYLASLAGLKILESGGSAILTTMPIARMIEASGYRDTLLVFGIIQGVVGLAAAQGLKRPPTTQNNANAANSQSRNSYSPARCCGRLRSG